LSSLQQRHGLSMARLADRCFDEFWDIGDSELLGRYVPDLDNLRAALHRTRDEPPTFARLASGLLPLLRRLSLMREAFSLAQEASALPEQTLQRDTLARLRLAIALVTYKHDDALRALELLRQTGDDRGVCLALHAIVHQKSLDKEEIAAACEEVRRLRQDNWTLKRQALGLSTEGWTALRCGNLTQAVDLYRKAIRYSDAAGADDAGTALRMQQYHVTIASGDLEAASKDAEDVLARCHALKNAYRLTCTQAAIVHLRLALGRIDSARELTAEFASFDRALGWPHACDIADALALLAASCDRVEDGARLAGFADKVNLERRGDASDQASEISRSRVEQLLQKQLAADRLLALKEEGKDLDIDQAVALALESKIA
jgi:tetratricopeptide (TPR) repeat protein